jgi:release factor glutamine methyltransferase
MTLAEVLKGATDYLAKHGVDSPRVDAELILARALGLQRIELYTQHDRPLTDAERAHARDLVQRRGNREPLAYILGDWDFRRLTLKTDARALVPRPETEIVVERCLALLEGVESPRVLDVGTGTGAIALALKHERPDLDVLASDASEAALEVARANAARLSLDVEFVHADLLDGMGDELDAIVANLPYVAERERATLAPEIVRHEPPQALFAGDDGLRAIRALIAQLPERKRIGAVALEVGAGQAGAVAGLLASAGFAGVECIADLAGMERVVAGERPRR